jgi:hypothetical protein
VRYNTYRLVNSEIVIPGRPGMINEIKLQMTVFIPNALHLAEVVLRNLKCRHRAHQIYEPWGLVLSRTGLVFTFLLSRSRSRSRTLHGQLLASNTTKQDLSEIYFGTVETHNRVAKPTLYIHRQSTTKDVRKQDLISQDLGSRVLGCQIVVFRH